MIGDQIALVSDETSRRRSIERRSNGMRGGSDSEMEFRDNDFHLSTRTPFADPSWRVEILDQGMQIVKELAGMSIGVSQIATQVVLSINSDFDENPEEGSDSTSGNVKFFLLRSDGIFDQRNHVDEYPDPTAIFTFPPA